MSETISFLEIPLYVLSDKFFKTISISREKKVILMKMMTKKTEMVRNDGRVPQKPHLLTCLLYNRMCKVLCVLKVLILSKSGL